ncbi:MULTISPECIES: tripartite tricarboxylate transporter substrate binding protein [unclassified Bordetella]|uniref:Bug family tripartite tricarboxylate transporter substrate binding protein n=1 Tax=unclassified Bordetella TaxID=2630031 RepID=UPI00132C7876|nr:MULTISPECIES: tripartite tricarboxylate transporter substrate binding protein [unclassified Bordetella]MVW72964.1 tripartite tricarboxylate transporter substrate binding protein [Bordetella sp. 15P40C-2]MVW79053.1 tripartite tricarboxylate transporter substrate binding protein [Bordetella sp. 02P26C-1]
MRSAPSTIIKKHCNALIAAGLVMISSVLAPAAQAADWPEKTVSIVVPFPAGGSTDVIGRMLAEGLGRLHPDTNVIVENVPGGATLPSVFATIKGGENGNKILMSAETSLFINKYSFKKPPYDADADLASVSYLYRTPHSLSVNPNSEYKTFADFVEAIKKNPGKISIAVNVIGGSAHLSLERWKQANNLDFEIVPYKGGVQAASDLMGGHIDAHVDVLGNTYPFAVGGKVKPLAILQDLKVSEFPDAVPQREDNPTDLTVPSVLILTVNGKTPKATIDKIYESINKVAQEEAFVEKMKTLQFELIAATPEESDKFRDTASGEFKKMFEMSGLPQN